MLPRTLPCPGPPLTLHLTSLPTVCEQQQQKQQIETANAKAGKKKAQDNERERERERQQDTATNLHYCRLAHTIRATTTHTSGQRMGTLERQAKRGQTRRRRGRRPRAAAAAAKRANSRRTCNTERAGNKRRCSTIEYTQRDSPGVAIEATPFPTAVYTFHHSPSATLP